MARLTARDYQGAPDVLGEAGTVEGPVPFPEPVLEALHRLVPCDVVAYHDGSIPWGPARVFVGEPGGPMTEDIRAAVECHWRQDPIPPSNGARKRSDFVSRREYRRLEIYQEADRPLGIEHMMRLWLDPTDANGARFEFDRGDRDFGERDRAVLDLLLPYLRRFRRRTARIRRLTPREQEILEHVAEGKTNAEVAWQLRISPDTVRKHLENTYSKLGVHTRTAAIAALSGRPARPDSGRTP